MHYKFKLAHFGYTVLVGLPVIAAAQAPAPTVTKSFGAATIPVGGSTSVTFVIANPGPGRLTNVGFTDTLPAGLVLGNSISANCTPGSSPGPITGNAGSQSMSISGTSLLTGGSCTVTRSVVGTSAGVQNNTTSAVTSTESGAGATSNTASVTVVAPAVLTKAFAAASLVMGGTTTLTFTLANPNTTVALTGVAFTDTLPAGLVIANPSAVVNTCSAAPVLTPVNLIALTGVSLAAGAICSFRVNVTGVADGSQANLTSTIASDNGGAGLAASAVVVVGNVYQVRYFSNLAAGDSLFNITNTGESLTVAAPVQNGNICVNIYSFTADEQLSNCCACPLTPNALAYNSARNDLVTNTLNPTNPTSLVVKLVASTGRLSGTGALICDAATVSTGSTNNVLTTGLAAWATTLHALPPIPGNPSSTYGLTETPFTAGTLSVSELARLTLLCSFIQANGSGFGICRSCRFGALGADKF